MHKHTILDDLNVIAQRDPQGALDFASREPAEFLRHDFGSRTLTFSRPIDSVVFAGMGGSGFPGEFVNTWPGVDRPFVVCKNYTLPQFVNKDTLVIAASYSGNTEETISAFQDAQKRGAQIVVMCNGGRLKEMAIESGLPHIQIPHCPQPRTAAFYFYKALVEILVSAKLAPADAPDQMAALCEPLTKAADNWAPSVPLADNLAKQLAEDLVGKTPIIYSGPLMYPAAYKWKIGANENAKNTAWCNYFPELSHNEFIGWSSHPVEKPFAVVDLVSSFEHPRVLKRFTVTERLLSGKRPAAIVVDAKGESPLEHLAYLILLGDFVTNYLAILNGVNPTPVALVEKFKKELA